MAAAIGAGVVIATAGTLAAIPGAEPDTPSAPEAWSAADYVDTPAVVSDGDVVCSTENWLLWCRDGASGAEVAEVELPGQVSTVVLAGETLVVTTEGGAGRGDVYGYSLSGERSWEAVDTGDVHGGETAREPPTPAVDEAHHVVAVPTDEVRGELVGIDTRTGQRRWTAFAGVTDDAGLTAPLGPVVAAGGHFFAVAADVGRGIETGGPAPQVVVALDAATGREDWRFDLDAGRVDQLLDVDAARLVGAAAPDSGGGGVGEEVTLALTVADEATGGDVGRVVVLDAASGAMRREVDVAGGSPTLAAVDDLVVVADADRVRAFAGSDERWATPAADLRERHPRMVVAEQGRLFLVGSGVHELDPADGTATLVRRLALAEDVAVAGGNLVLAGADVVAVELRP